MDKYQGQQNQYVLLSLVRTRAVGHLRDPRRLVVAMSRARLGLYVFGRAQLFAGCYELQPTFKCAAPSAFVLRRGMLAWEWSVQHDLQPVSLIELVPSQPDKNCSSCHGKFCSHHICLPGAVVRIHEGGDGGGGGDEVCKGHRHLLARPTQLALHPTGETFDACTRPLSQVRALCCW